MPTPEITEFPLSRITPQGWLKQQLEYQRDGLTGHLEVAGRPFGILGWKYTSEEKSKIVWEPYEQDGYWIDGMIRTALLLNDETFTAKARETLDFVLAHADADGYLGHPHLKDVAPPEETWTYARRRRWAHAVFFRAFMADGLEPERKYRVIKALENHYVNTTYPHIEGRELCNIEIMLWVYQHTGNKTLLDMAVADFFAFNEQHGDHIGNLESLLSDDIPEGHGVTYNEMAKLGAILYRFSGNKQLLEASLNAYHKLEKYQVLVDGVCSSSEHLRGKDPLDSHETCDISDQTWSQGYLLMATGDTIWADRIERACLNAGLGSVTDDFKALQYFSCPNQVVADATSNHNTQFCGKQQLSYRPRPGTPCCPGNVHRYMPNYSARMWMQHESGRLLKMLYGPSEFSTCINGTPVTIRETSNFPFDETIHLKIDCQETVTLSLGLRIPGWAQGASVKINGELIESGLNGPMRYDLDRQFNPNDSITLVFPQAIALTQWPGGGIAVERGPLVYSLPIASRLEVDANDQNQSEDFPAWNMYPTSPWAYALAINEDNLANIKANKHSTSDEDYPFAAGSTPLSLTVPAYTLNGWDIDRRSELVDENKGADDIQAHREVRHGDFQFTPPLPPPNKIGDMQGEQTTIELVPYGSTTLRMTIFPQATAI